MVFVPDTPPPERALVPPESVLPDSFFQPEAFTAPTSRNQTISLNIGGTQYNGFLINNFSDRLTRLNRLLITILRVLYRLMGGLNFKVTKTINLPNPFDKPNWPGPITVNKEGFEGLVELVDLLHRKVDNLHLDLPLIVPVASVPEHWQIPKEAGRPQCVFLFGEWETGQEFIGPPKYQTAVPHFSFNLAATFDNTFGYWKGARQGIVTLDDNSKIIVYARDDDELDRVFFYLLAGIPANKKAEAYTKKGSYSGLPFATKYVRLRRIDNYPNGGRGRPISGYLWLPREASVQT